MEKRRQERLHWATRVVVYHHGMPVLSSQTCNLSRSGLLCGPNDPGIERGDPVQLEFPELRDADHRPMRLSARVIHHSGGLGLRFARSSDELLRAVQRRRADTCIARLAADSRTDLPASGWRSFPLSA